MPPLYDVTAHPLLQGAGNKFLALKTPEERLAQNELAEQYLGLVPPAYTDEGDIAHLELAIAMQILFQMDQGTSPLIHKSEAQNKPGITTAYRDRFIHPGAAQIVARVTKTAQTIFTPATFGV